MPLRHSALISGDQAITGPDFAIALGLIALEISPARREPGQVVMGGTSTTEHRHG